VNAAAQAIGRCKVEFGVIDKLSVTVPVALKRANITTSLRQIGTVHPNRPGD
jgi:hypothetical protein